MKDEDKTKDQLINELIELRQRITGLQGLETEHKGTEEALRVVIAKAEEEKAKSEAIIAAIGDILTIQDTNFKIIYQNKVSKDLVGDHVGEYCYKVYEQKDSGCEGCALALAFKDGNIHRAVRTDVTSPIGIIDIEITASPLRDSTGKIIAGIEVARDITERRRVEQALRQSEEHLRQAQKMEAVGRLAGGVTHDFNNQLTTIIGYGQLLQNKLAPDDPRQKYAQEILKAGKRASSLTRQLLTFSRSQMLQPKMLDLNAVVANIEKMLRRLIGEDIELVTLLESGLECVKADPGQIDQMVMNLAVNARDAMPRGGKLTIKTEGVTLEEEHCNNISEARPGRFVCFSFADTGVGMDKETLQHIFDPFFTTKGVGEGSGLGLSVVYGIVKQHGGWIDVYSEPGRGSTFKVNLPVFLPIEAEYETKEITSIQELRGSGEGILLVEDEAGVREFLKKVLGENGYVVFEAARAEEALDIFEREKEKISLVFSDVVLPDMNGLQLVDQLISRQGGIRVLLSSGYRNQKSRWRDIQQRGFSFIRKPYTVPTMLRAIKNTIEQS